MSRKRSPKRPGPLAGLGRNMKDTATLAATSAAVIGARLTDVKCGELARMGPEKAVAAIAAGNAWMFAAWRIAAAFSRDTAAEAAAGMDAARAAAASPFPLAAVFQYQAASLSRAASRAAAATDAVLTAQREILRPYRSAAGANLRRLSKRTR